MTRAGHPVAMAAVLGVAAIATAIPWAGAALVLDRDAIAAGQWWRLLTGHLVHFSARHLLLDAVVLGAAGWMLAHERVAGLAWFGLAVAGAVGAGVLLLEPGIARFGGLSGVATAMLALALLRGLEPRGAPRWVNGALLVALAAKLALELATHRFLALAATPPDIVPVPSSHLTGALVAVAWWGLGRRARARGVNGWAPDPRDASTPPDARDPSPELERAAGGAVRALLA